eukprot:5507648-Pleurochrysis_carterae.AAC.3
MDYAVIQQGRLAEKQKALSKEEALAVVRYGADKVGTTSPHRSGMRQAHTRRAHKSPHAMKSETRA